MIALFVVLSVAGIWLFCIKMKIKPKPANLAIRAVIGFIAVKITLDDEEPAKSLPMGNAGMATIYTQKGKPFQIISKVKVTVRIKAIMEYLVPM
ncbi:hypothetical protein C5Y96_00580 [Blastopirellula marina]|uniref:Uncharacterized protein n=1 Tax=Blastopirellula marina TaxID=124 RepID=A0A2S8G9U9_9BACT|nr:MULTISPECIES: hypothetical protein [Pirellulaceae]PQO41245.1 hypothetical protein C5Y96_00580 [Blastopirellula marina]RCS56269.1 hypothetical protein DTL36_00580 [Bremerella cremea]